MNQLSVSNGTSFARSIVAVLFVSSLVACGGADSSTGPAGTGGASAYIRYVNGAYKTVSTGPTTVSVYQGEGFTSTTQSTTATFEPATIDILIDSSLKSPSVIALAPASRSSGTLGPAPANLASAGYIPVGRGVRGFVARQNGLSPKPGYSFFTTATPTGAQEHIPRQYLTAKTYYTLGIAGTIAAPDSNGAATINPPRNIIFNLATDNPFAPPTSVAGGSQAYMARFQVYNFATWGGPNLGAAQWDIYLTPGSTPPTLSYDRLSRTGTALSYTDTTAYRRYINASAGTYYLSLVVYSGGLQKVWGTAVTFKAGEVHTYIIVNDMPTFTATTKRTYSMDSSGEIYSDYTTVTTPTPPTFKILAIVDNQY